MRPQFSWSLPGRSLTLGRRTLIMGVVNVTPDSFYDGGRFAEFQAAVDQALRLADQGADIIDVGGESARPFSEGIPAEEEKARVVPVIDSLAKSVTKPIAIDTKKAEVARAALAAGASIINDISGAKADPEIVSVAAETGCGLVLMHMRGSPKNMQLLTEYDNLMAEIKAELSQSVEAALAAGVRPEAVVLDPGLGFAKKPEHNLEIIRRLDELAELGYPLLIGPSRKSFIGRALEEDGLNSDPEERLWGTLAAVALSAFGGAHIVRVHDVIQTRQALAVADGVREGAYVPRSGETAGRGR
ncbi:MAG: dihydropteroate synthase [Deltaproteobacteria bacterium]|nr:dihydropteroate synthase [Deltaproteobacteria bacterium]